jgi:hypothetical protein
MFVIAHILLASNVGFVEPSWLRGDLFLLVLGISRQCGRQSHGGSALALFA